MKRQDLTCNPEVQVWIGLNSPNVEVGPHMGDHILVDPHVEVRPVKKWIPMHVTVCALYSSCWDKWKEAAVNVLRLAAEMVSSSWWDMDRRKQKKLEMGFQSVCLRASGY